jgi:hypothetical protein
MNKLFTSALVAVVAVGFVSASQQNSNNSVFADARNTIGRGAVAAKDSFVSVAKYTGGAAKSGAFYASNGIKNASISLKNGVFSAGNTIGRSAVATKDFTVNTAQAGWSLAKEHPVKTAVGAVAVGTVGYLGHRYGVWNKATDLAQRGANGAWNVTKKVFSPFGRMSRRIGNKIGFRRA